MQSISTVCTPGHPTYPLVCAIPLSPPVPHPAAAQKHAEAMNRVADSFKEMWIADRGHPAAFREELGHRRNRPDAWL